VGIVSERNRDSMTHLLKKATVLPANDSLIEELDDENVISL
jgi:hypothetical protein